MTEKIRKPIGKRKKLPQFTIMNVIEGQAGLENYSSLFFYSLTIDNILNIIVLLILAGVALNLTIGQNGIFARAQNAVNVYEQAATNEQQELGKAEDIIDDYLNGNGGNQGGGDDTTVVDDVTIPDGFYYAGGSKDTGLVISDDPDDEIAWDETTSTQPVSKELEGNQFVWVPVENPGLFQRYDGYVEGMLESDYMEQQGMSNFWESLSEPLASSSWETTEYNLMRTSVINNKGFYVARYEASEGTGESAGKVQSKAGATPWVNIPWGTSMTEIGTTGAVYQAQNMYNDNEHAVTSTLIYGVQWDAIMNFIDPNYSKEDGTCNSFVSNSTDQGWYDQSSATNCGYYQVNNIYDLAGNVIEWTMEADSLDHRVVRGGVFGRSGLESPVSGRGSYDPDYGGSGSVGFRVALYL